MANHGRENDKGRNESQVQGEGDYESDRRFRKHVAEFVEETDIEDAAKKAKDSREGKERDDLERAEQVGKEKAKGFDPKVKRD